jgi:hypothetical protein
MPRESTITVLRSTSVDVPTGLTFGEIAYSDLNGKLFVGKNNGTSLWIGAGVTDTSITNNSSYLVPTQSAVKTYVDGIVGGGSVVNSFNGTGGNIVLTGDSGSVIKITSGADNTITNRLATTSATGVASFNSTYFSVASGAVSLASAYQVTGDTVVAGTGIGVSRTGRTATVSNTGVLSFNGNAGTIEIASDGGAVALTTIVSAADYAKGITVRLASTSLTGVASFNSTDFTVSAGGQVAINTATSVPFVLRDEYGSTVSPKYGATVTITGGFGIETDIEESITNAIAIKGVTASSTKVGVASYDSAHFSVGSTAHVRLATAYQVTGDTVQGDSGAITTSGTGTKTVSARLATTSLTGVASFNSTYFGVASGAVSLASAYQVTGDTVVAGTGISITRNGNSTTITNEGVVSVNGQDGTVVFGGDGGAITLGSNETTIKARIASTSLTGVASFNTTNFTVSAAGAVSSNAITVKASSGDGGGSLNLGGSLTLTGTAAQINVTRSGTDFTLAFPNDITIPGNLTVNGTVVTANVDSFMVEDPLIMLGTGNAADSVDLGFYGQFTSSGKRFAGLYRDASDSGKFKLFTGLTGTAEPTTFVNDGGSGYTVGTLVAKIDGGTF